MEDPRELKEWIFTLVTNPPEDASIEESIDKDTLKRAGICDPEVNKKYLITQRAKFRKLHDMINPKDPHEGDSEDQPEEDKEKIGKLYRRAQLDLRTALGLDI